MMKPPPDNVDVLKKLLLQQQARNEQLESQVLTLQEQRNLALAKRYAANSKKITANQLHLFDEAEVDVDASDESMDKNEPQTTLVAQHTRSNKTGRKKLPDSLPHVDMVHEIHHVEQVCDVDGKPLIEIGNVVTEQLDIIPAKIQVIRHIRKKYACSCGQCIKTALLPNQPIPKNCQSGIACSHHCIEISGCLTVVSSRNNIATHLPFYL